MAEGILRSILPAELEGQIQVGSAGTGAIEGVPATPLAVSTAASRKIDIRNHRARKLTAALLLESDLVLCMEAHHMARAREISPEASERISLIMEQGADKSAPESGIRDPIGGGAAEYDDTFNRIRSHLLRWLPRIREAVERSEGVR